MFTDHCEATLPTGHLLIEVSKCSADLCFLAEGVLERTYFIWETWVKLQSHEYSVALLHSELAAYSEGGIRQDKENSKRNSICLNFNKKCQYTQKARPKELVSFNEELYLISVASDFKP